MREKLVNSQLTTWKTFMMHRYICCSMAKNVFCFDDLSEKTKEFIDIDEVNSTLLHDGSIAWFKDEVLDCVLALPYTSLAGIDRNGIPTLIEVRGKNNYRKTLHKGEFVIMFDNSEKISIYPFVLNYAERLSLNTRVADVNIGQQKTMRVWKTKSGKEESLKAIISNSDAYVEEVMTYDDIDLDDTQCVVAPAPFVADKIDTHKDKVWSEFLMMIGVTSVVVQKKERMIQSEISSMLGGNYAMRFSRFEPRKSAIDKINKLFNENIKVSYYDGDPTTKKEEREEDENDNEQHDISISNNE